MRAALLAVLVSFGCTKSNTVQCGDSTCPAGTHCGASAVCVPDACGDGTVDDLEECDGNDSIPHETLRCTDYGFYLGPALTCSDSCAIDTSACRDYCGDHIVNGLERCDGVPATGFACTDFGFDVGTVSCNDACSPGFDFCSNIGWQLVPGGATNELLAVYLATQSSGVAVGKGGEIIAAKDGIWLPVPQTESAENLNGIYGNAGTIIAVGDKGTILRYDGTTVTKMTSPTTVDLNDVSGVLAGAIAVGDAGTILRFDGTTWTAMTSPTNVDLYGVHVVNATTAYAVGNGNTVLKLEGTSWTNLTTTLTWTAGSPPATGTITFFSVFVVDGAVFVAGNESTVARIVNDSLGVVPPRPFDLAVDFELHAVWGTSPTDVFVSGQNGVVLHWNGLYLTVQDTPTNRTIYGLDGADGRLVGVTRGGSVIAFNGTSRHVSSPTTTELFAVHTDGTRVVAAGRSLASLLPNGNWDTVATIPTARSVFVLDNAIFTGSQTQGLYRFDRQNLATAPINVSASGVNGVWATASRVITVGDKVIESADPSSTSFSQTTTTTVHEPAILQAVWAAPDGIWFAVGTGGTAIRRALNGTWAAIPTGVSATLLAVWGTASDDVFAVGTTGTILHWNGTAWRQMYTGVAENLVSISGNSHSDITVTGTSYMRMHYDGISWSRMSSYGLDTPSVSTYRGTTWYVSGTNIERSDQTIGMMETKCGDPFDNDSTGGNNCDDPDCFDAGQCRTGGACLTLQRVTCETAALETSTFTGVSRLNDIPCLDHSTPGTEASYRYVAETSGTVTVTITDATAQLDLVVTDATLGHCNLDNCQQAVAGEGTKSATFTATAGQMYYIVVDGPVGVGAPFTLSVACD